MRRRTKKQYHELYDNPFALFGTADVILWPNGEKEIWIRGKSRRHGIRIVASEGPAGFGIQISGMVGTAPVSITGNAHGDYATFKAPDAAHIELCQYNADPESQEYKEAYLSGDNERLQRASEALKR